jgi:hypothetical protein
MQIITDEERIAKGARIGKIATFIGLGFLVAGLIISLALQASPLIWVSFVCMLVGLLASSIGTMNMNRWVREPRADQALAQGLKGFDDRYQLYNYFLPAPHVFLTPVGLFVLTALGQDGVIRYDGGKFRRDFSLGRALRFMAEEGLGKPFADADAQVQAMQELVDGAGLGDQVEIQNILVFYNPRAQLEVSDLPRPVVTAKGLKKVIRKYGGSKLPGEKYRQLEELLDETADLELVEED